MLRRDEIFMHGNKGRKFSISHKLKLRLSNLGKKRSEEVRKNISLGKKGKPSPFKGLKNRYSKESIEKMRKAGQGKTYTENYRKKQSESHRGIKHYNWKGGITKEQLKIRRSIEIRLWRESVFARDNWTCQECGQRGGKLNAHHIKPFAKFIELRTSVENGITLCKQCHIETHKQLRKT